MFLASTLLLSALARAGAPTDGPPEAPVSPGTTGEKTVPEALAPPTAVLVPDQPLPGEQRLDAAIRSYMQGAYDQARTELTGIVNDATITDTAIRVKALTFLGEVLFLEDNKTAAWDAFQNLLIESPDATLDPFVHPPDVVAFFETVKAASVPIIPRPRPPAPSQTARWPVYVYGLAFPGVYRWAHGKPVVGGTVLASEIALGVGSLMVYVSLDDLRGQLFPKNQIDEITRQETTLRWVGRGLSVAFWMGFVANGVDVAVDVSRRDGQTVSVGFTPEGLTLTF
jgi:hypothetical protein